MTKPITSLLLLFALCAMLGAAGPAVSGTSKDNVRGSVAETVVETVTAVLTNLSITGTPNPDVTGVYTSGTWTMFPIWFNTNGYNVRTPDAGMSWWLSTLGTGTPTSPPAAWSNVTIEGTYNPYFGGTGDVSVAYYYVTNSTYTTNRTPMIRGR